MGTDAESISITMDDILAVQNSHVEIKRWRQIVVVADRLHDEDDGVIRRGIQKELLALKSTLKLTKSVDIRRFTVLHNSKCCLGRVGGV